jgi:disulfide bond formation protein DsbB
MGNEMTRWIMIAMTLLGLLVAIFTRSPGLLGLALILVFIGLFGTVLSFAADRISANSRPDASMLPPEALKAIRDKANNARAQERAAQAADGARQPAVPRREPLA